MRPLVYIFMGQYVGYQNNFSRRLGINTFFFRRPNCKMGKSKRAQQFADLNDPKLKGLLQALNMRLKETVLTHIRF